MSTIPSGTGVDVARSDQAVNLAVVVGRLSRPPAEVTLPSGSRLVRYDVTVRAAGQPAESVPVAWFDPPATATTLRDDDEVVVVGRVRRRFYRRGGGLQSSTEVVASTVAPAGRARGRRRALAALEVASGVFADASRS